MATFSSRPSLKMSCKLTYIYYMMPTFFVKLMSGTQNFEIVIVNYDVHIT